MAYSADQKFFNLVHGNYLIYNTCWEDPRIDRELLGLDSRSRMVVITSAGCNILDYLLDEPAAIYAVDLNFRQNALLELKMAVMAVCGPEELFALFGVGGCAEYRKLYQSVRPCLSRPSRGFWDRHIHYFNRHGLRWSFYWRGGAGFCAWFFRHLLINARPRIRRTILELLEAADVQEQSELFARIEPELWGRLTSWLMSRPAVMSLMGVPAAQIGLIDQKYPRGLEGFIQDRIRRVFTEVPIADNYFWRVYLTGSYTPRCCPNYLKRRHHAPIRDHLAAIHPYAGSVADFLERHPGSYTHFVLLDHQDWLAGHDHAELEREWRLILESSAPRAKILMRSAGLELSFLPAWVQTRLNFFPELTEPLHARDRVGTYGSLHLAEVA